MDGMGRDGKEGPRNFSPGVSGCWLLSVIQFTSLSHVEASHILIVCLQ